MPNLLPTLLYEEIVSLRDEKYDDWLDLYQTAFPLTEQVKISALNQMLRRTPEDTSSFHFLLVREAAEGQTEGRTAGLALYEDAAGDGAAVLWYLAVMPEQRSRGLGAEIYREIRRRLAAQPGVRLLFLEVEDPDTCASEEERILAQRRIGFYRRLGAQRLSGITYTQSVGWQPAMTMHLMVDLLEEMPPNEVLALARGVFGDAMQTDGKAALV